MSNKHPFDAAAEQLEAIASRPVAAQVASTDYWELRSAADAPLVGDYPQAVFPEPPDWGDSDGLGADGFPAAPIPEQVLQPAARWTDVISSNLWSEGQLFNDKALAAFQRCDLGSHRTYPAIVRDHAGTPHRLTYLHIRNVVEPSAIDFGRSEFYLADMIGVPQGPVVVESFDDWEDKVRRARKGRLDGCEEFSKLVYKKLYFRPGHAPSANLFTLARLGITVYISARLKAAIEESGITGLEIRANKRLFAES